MTAPKIHTQFDTETNQRLDQLFADWTFADNYAASVDYKDSARNFEAKHLAWLYEVDLQNAKTYCKTKRITADDQAVALPDLDLIAPLIKTADAPEFANYRICDVLPELEKQADSWKHRHPTGYKLALQAVETHKQALAEREAKINALTAPKLRHGGRVWDSVGGDDDDGQWANWDESSPVYGLSW